MVLPIVVFDVNETLSDMAPLGDAFRDVGLPEHAARLWFATLLRDGFALTAAGDARGFAEIGAATLRPLLIDAGVPDVEGAVQAILGRFQHLDVHPDVVEGVRALQRMGARLVTLTNGGVATSEALFTRAGIRDAFDLLLSVEDAGAWKPARAAYEYATARTGAPAAELLLVAVHPWDIHGAASAGLRTAWLNRSGASYPSVFREPELTVPDLPELAARLGEG